jgi:opine dehydrogenase
MNLAEMVQDAEMIICTTPAHVHKYVARDLSSLLKPGQILVLNPGRTCGVMEVRKVLQEQGCIADVCVVETQTILYACRRKGAEVKVFGTKRKVPCAGKPQSQMPRFFELIAQVFPEFTEAPQGLWETSLDNIGMLFHPAPTLLNLGRMESQKPFDYYIDGFTPTVAALVEKLDAERLKVAEALGIKLPTVVEWVRNTYGVKGSNLYEALQNNEAYRGISAPVLADANAKKELRYVIEDVPSGLVPVSELGRKFGVATPAIDMVISLADTIFEADFRSSGRNLEQVGLADMDPDEIIKLQ